MPDLGFDKKKFTCKHGYCTGKAIDLADPSLHVKAQDYKRRVSNMMRALSPEDIARIPRARNYSVSRKYDGENAMLFFDGKQMLSVNAGGTVRTGLPGFDEAVELLKKAKVASCTLAAEIYVRKGATKAHPVQQVVRVLRNPPSKEKLEDLGVAVFDVLEVDGEQVTSVVDVYRYLNKWFGKGKRVHPAEERFVEKPEDIMQAFAEWVIAEGSEGLVVRSDQAGWFKVKSRHSLDAAVIGYSEGTDERKGMLHDLLVAVIRPDGTFQEFTRVGGGFSEEDRRSFVADLKKRVVPSDYVAVNNDYVAYEMVRPGLVIEISCLDLIAERARGGPVKRMVLDWDGKRYTALVRMPLVSVISPQFVRVREDKEAVVDDVSIRQVTDLIAIPDADRSAHEDDAPKSEILERTVYTKVMKGNTMVRKLLLWKTNKADRGDFPGFVVYLTDFSPNRKEPLEREIKISNNEKTARKFFKEMAEKNFIGGWEKAG